MTAALALVASVLVFAGSAARATSIKPYTSFFHADTNGAIVQIGNNLESCPTATSGCTQARAGSGSTLNNNNWNMAFVNADPTLVGNPAFFSSSSANLTLPTGATVLYAQLSWGARTRAGTNGSNAPPGQVSQVQFRVPGASTYQTISASNVYGNDPTVSDGMYHTFANVTSIVQQAGSGTYWGANVLAATGQDRYAGWSLVVAVGDPAQPLRDLSVFDGFAIVDSPAGETIQLSGFLTPQFGTVNASVGVVAYEGDLGITGDQLKLNTVPLSDTVVPANNFFNAGNSALGTLNQARSPADVNMFGFDVKTVAADGVLPNGATSATVNLTTSQDTYAPGVVTTSINLRSPVFPPSSKSVVNVTSSTTQGSQVGDTLEYTIDLPNTGGDGAAQAVITDALPGGIAYVAGSLRYATGTANGPLGSFATLTDAPGDDNGEFLSGTPPGGSGSVVVRAGVGATATTGGTIRPNDRVVVKFRVTVQASAAGTTISNTDQLNYNLATLGTPVTRTGLPAAISVASRADLSITKSGGPSPLAPGQDASYLLTVVNNGPGAATGVVAGDALPLSMTFVSATPSVGGPCTFSAPQVSCPLGTLAVGQTVTVGVVAHLPASATGISSVNDVASVTSTTDDPVASNNVSSITTPVRPTADVGAAIAVTAGSPATPGNQVSVTLTATNVGPSDAANAILTADLGPLTNVAFSGAPPAGCTLAGTVVTCTSATLAAGASLPVTVVATVSPAQTGASVTLSDRVTTSTFDPNDANDVASTVLPLAGPSADIVVTKSASSSSVVAGQPFAYTLTVTSSGPSNAAAVTLTDPLPAQFAVTDVTPSRGSCQPPGATVTCSFGTFAPGGTATVVLTGTVPADAATGPFSNTVSGSSTTSDPNAANNVATAAATVVANVDVAITKTASPVQAIPGSPMTFTLNATNNGPSVARSVSITDTLPSPLVFNSVTNANGTCTAPPAGTVGGTITCGVGDIPPDGTTRAVTVVVTVPASFTTAVNNTATVTSQTTDLNPANDTASYQVSASPVADVSLTKVITSPTPADPLVAGVPVTWALTATNSGPSDAANVQVTDPVPSALVTNVTATFGPTATPCTVTGATVTCTVGTVPAGQSVVVTVSGTVLATAPNGSLLTNSASVSSTTADPTTSNNTDTTISSIVTSADLALTKNPPSATVDAGGTITYTFTLTNNGPSVAVTPKGVDVLPPGVSVVPASVIIPPGWSCSLAGRGATCVDANNLGVGQSATVQVGLKADTTLPAGTLLTDTATISSPTADPNPTNDVASAAATVTVSADLQVAKSVTPSPLVAGAPATYTISVTNNGPSDAAAVTVTDPLPVPGPADVSPSQGTCTQPTGTVTCDLGTVPAGATATVAIVATVPTNATGSLSNTASVTSQTPDPNGANNNATTTASITSLADVRIVKTESATTIAAGGVVDYTLTVTNTGPSDAVGVTATDVIGPGFTPVPANSAPACTLGGSTFTCPAGTLTPGATASFTIEVRADSALAPGDYPNTATATATTPDPNPTNNTSTATVTVQRIADLSMVKSADVSAPAAGTQYTYTLSATNSGPSDAPNVVVTDTLPAALTFVSSPDTCNANGQLVTCTAPTIAPGARVDFQVVVALSPAAPPGPLTNTAAVTADVTDPNPTNNTGTDTITVQVSADLSITKQLVSNAVVAGEPATYQITVTNHGPSDATGVTVTDTLPNATLATGNTPAGPCTTGTDTTVTCPIGPLPLNTTATFTLTFTIDPTATGTLTNTATATATSFDPALTNNTATNTNPTLASADLSITKSVGAPQFTAGGPVSWTMTVHNAGPSNAQSVLVDDPVDPAVSGVTITSGPAGVCTAFPCNIGTLAVGDTVDVFIAGSLSPSFTGAALRANGSVSSPTPDPDLTNNDATVVTPVVNSADLQVTKTGPHKTEAGSPITWTVNVSNMGPSDAHDVSVTDPVPNIVGGVQATSIGASCQPTANVVNCTASQLAAGATMSITIDGTVADNAPEGPLTNSASAQSTTTDPNDSNNTATSTTQISPVADLSVTKRFTSAAAVPGSPVSWEMVITDGGPSDATGTVVTDPMPAGVTVTSVTPAVVGCSTASNVVTCPVGTVASGASVTLDITGTLEPSFTGAALDNTATVDAATIDPTPSNNTATTSTPVTPQASLSVMKTAAPNMIVQGGTTTYTITAHNAGPSDAIPLTITDPLPSGMVPITAQPSNGTCTIALSARVVTCTSPSLPAGDTATVTIQAQAASDAAVGPSTNTASAAAGNVAGNVQVHGEATVRIQAAPAPAPSVTQPLARTGATILELLTIAGLLIATGALATRRRH